MEFRRLNHTSARLSLVVGCFVGDIRSRFGLNVTFSANRHVTYHFVRLLRILTLHKVGGHLNQSSSLYQCVISALRWQLGALRLLGGDTKVEFV